MAKDHMIKRYLDGTVDDFLDEIEEFGHYTAAA